MRDDAVDVVFPADAWLALEPIDAGLLRSLARRRPSCVEERAHAARG